MFCYATNIPKDYNNSYQNQCYFVSSEIFSFSFNDTKYLMQHKLLLQLNNISFFFIIYIFIIRIADEPYNIICSNNICCLPSYPLRFTNVLTTTWARYLFNKTEIHRHFKLNFMTILLYVLHINCYIIIGTVDRNREKQLSS